MYSIALEGGGAKGAFHMGAIKALMENGYEFNAIAGTSIGALNGAIIAQGDAEMGYEMWESLTTSDLFDVNDEYLNKFSIKELDKDTLRYFASKARTIIENKGIDTTKMRNVIESMVDEDKLRNSPIDFGLVTVSITDLKPVELFKDEIPKGQMVDYLMASANFPGFISKSIDGKHFADGGLYDNLPVNLLASRGYKNIIAIRTHGVGVSKKIKYRNIKLMSILPSEDLGATLEFDHDMIVRNLQMGYYDTLKVLRGLKGNHYYIEPLGEDHYFELISSIPDDLIKAIGKTLGISNMNTKRMLFERIVPSIARALGLKSDASYETIFLSLLEVYAEELSVEKYTIYSLTEFLNVIREKTSDNEIEGDSSILPTKLLHAINRLDKKEQLLRISKDIFEMADMDMIESASASL